MPLAPPFLFTHLNRDDFPMNHCAKQENTAGTLAKRKCNSNLIMEVDEKMGFASQEFANFAGIHLLNSLVENFDVQRNRIKPDQLLDIIRHPEGLGHVFSLICVASEAEFFRADFSNCLIN